MFILEQNMKILVYHLFCAVDKLNLYYMKKYIDVKTVDAVLVLMFLLQKVKLKVIVNKVNHIVLVVK